MAYNVNDIANTLLRYAENTEGGDLMSNMKLQKMLYYQQGFHLAMFGTPLFEDDMEAWMYVQWSRLYMKHTNRMEGKAYRPIPISVSLSMMQKKPHCLMRCTKSMENSVP